MRQMARPRVVSEFRRAPVEREPPSDTHPHDWLPADSLGLYERASKGEGCFDIYVSSVAERKIRNQATEAAPKLLEVMGLLLGEVCEWRRREYVVVRDVSTTALQNTPSKVKFDPDALPRLFTEMDAAGFDYIVVGWYHSHPGHTCFLSRTDLHTQRTLFDQPFHCALVIDPVNEEFKAFKLSGSSYAEAPFAMLHDPLPRVRRLKRGDS